MVSFWSYLVSKFKGNALAAGITLAELKEKWASEHYTRITHNASLAQLHEAMHLLEEKFKITKETEEIN